MTKDNYDDRCMQALAEARAYINKHGPYFAKVIYGLVPHFHRGLGTLGVSKGLVLIVDPVWFVDMEKELGDYSGDKEEHASAMRGAVLVHEAMHVLRGLERVAAMPNHNLANVAFDIPINDDLADVIGTGGAKVWPLPAWANYSSTYGFDKGLTGEQYYELLEKNAKKLIAKGVLSPGDLGHGDGSGVGDGADSDDGGSPGSGSGSSGKEAGRKVASGRCGSCAGGAIDKELEQKIDAEIGRTSADVQRIRKEALKDAREAAQRGRGSVPNSLKELLDEPEQKSVIDWRQRTSRIIRTATGRVVSGQSDFSLKRISKRSFTRGVIRPGMIDRKVEVAFIEDSSGSMGAEQLLACRVECVGVLSQLGIHIAWFLDADASVAAKPVRLSLSQIATYPVHGRGGTDFRPALRTVRELKPKPDIVFYMTDGDGVAPTTPPQNIEVVWCIVPTPYGRRPATWGHLVVVSDDQQLMEPYMQDEE